MEKLQVILITLKYPIQIFYNDNPLHYNYFYVSLKVMHIKMFNDQLKFLRCQMTMVYKQLIIGLLKSALQRLQQR